MKKLIFLFIMIVVIAVSTSAALYATSVDANPSGGQIKPGQSIKITASAPSGGGIAYFRYMWDDGDEPFVDGSSLTIKAPKKPGDHKLTLFASDKSGSYNSVTKDFHFEVVELSAPTGLSATAKSSSSIKLTWNSVSGATSYKIYRDSDYLKAVDSTNYTDTGLEPDTRYKYYVIAKNSSGSSEESKTVSETTMEEEEEEELSAPTGLSATAKSNSSIKLTWNSVSKATSYKIYRNSDFLTTVDSTSYTDTGLEPDTSYKYYVIAKNSSGTSSASNTVSGTTQESQVTAPSAPTGLSISIVNTNQVYLCWSTVSNASYYQIYRDGSFVNKTDKDKYTDTNLTAGKTYTYYIKAVGTTGLISSQSDSKSIIIPTSNTTPTTLSTPTWGAATAVGANQINLTWNAVSGATSYQIFRNNTSTLIATVNSVNYLDTGLTAGTTYCYYLKALNNNASSNISPSISAATAQTTINTPAAPTLSIINNNQVYIAWSIASNVSYYQIFRNGSIISTTNNSYINSYTDTNLIPGQSYSYYIKAVGSNGVTSNQSESRSITVPATSITAPTGLAATVNSNNYVNLTWNSVSNTSYYQIFRNDTNTPIGTAYTNSYQDTGVISGSVYYYYVKALNSSGVASGLSTACSVNISQTTMNAPTILNISITNNNQVYLSWSTVSNVSYYQVYRNGSIISTTNNSYTNSYTDTNLIPGQSYSYYIKAVGSNGVTSNQSESRSITVTATSITAPTGLAATVNSNNYVNLTWNSVSNTSYYQIFRNDTNTPIGTAYTNSYQDTGVISGSVYYYYVKALNSSGVASGLSAACSVNVSQTTMNAPATLNVSVVNTNQVYLSWSAVSNVSYYQVYRNGSIVSNVYTNSYTDIGVITGQTYTYYIKAVGSSGAVSNQSESKSIIVSTTNNTNITFTDLPQTHWAYNAVMQMVNMHIVEGFSDNTFRPNDTVTREQFAKILTLSLGNQSVNPSTATFADVSPNSEWYRYVETAKRYLTGYKYNNVLYFNGSSAAMREDMAVAIVRAKGLDTSRTSDLSVLNQFVDNASISPALRNFVALAVQDKDLQGDNGYLNPKGTLTRAQACQLMYQAGIISSNAGEKVIIGN